MEQHRLRNGAVSCDSLGTGIPYVAASRRSNPGCCATFWMKQRVNRDEIPGGSGGRRIAPLNGDCKPFLVLIVAGRQVARQWCRCCGRRVEMKRPAEAIPAGRECRCRSAELAPARPSRHRSRRRGCGQLDILVPICAPPDSLPPPSSAIGRYGTHRNLEGGASDAGTTDARRPFPPRCCGSLSWTSPPQRGRPSRSISSSQKLHTSMSKPLRPPAMHQRTHSYRATPMPWRSRTSGNFGWSISVPVSATLSLPRPRSNTA